VGSGTYVSKVLPERMLQIVAQHAKKLAVPKKRRPGPSDYARRAKLFEGYQNRPTRAFRANLPALDLFPTELWTKIAMRRLRRISRQDLMGCDALGYVPLREAVADYLGKSRGVKCGVEQLMIVSGVQEAIDLAARVILNAGDVVSVEDPGYPGAELAFRACGARVCSAKVDNEGVDVRLLPVREVRLGYVTPGHQFPLGTTMGLARRLQLLEWARKSGALIFEDDYDSEFRYRGRPIPALQGLDQQGLVLYAGTFSKVMFPSLRLGYLVIPQGMIEAFEAAKSLCSRHAPLLEQVVLCDFIVEGHFARHLRRMREVYAGRLGTLMEEARQKLAGSLEISSVEAGLQTVGWLLNGMDGEGAARKAAERDVEVTPLSRYARGRLECEGLQMGFAAVDEKEIRRGVEELARALEKAYCERQRG
jgi:GntR family transcriptional regulator/MocR family aminotransferase